MTNTTNTQDLHILYTPFTGVGLHGGFRGNKWLEHRIGIFKNYTLKSLLNQSNRNFIHWFSFRPEEKDNQFVLGLADYLKQQKYNFIFTFDGLMYWDDKFNTYTLKQRARNFLMIMWDMWIYKELKNPKTIWKYTWENKNETLVQRIANSIQIIASVLSTNYDWIYMTRIDSDDMFHSQVVDLIQNQEPEERKALIFKNGYILNTQTGQVAEWNPPTNPPFHTIIFPKEVFFDAQKHREYYRDFTSHEDIPRVFNCVELDLKGFLVSFHGKHISTAWNSPLPRKAAHLIKYGKVEPFKVEPKPYCYTTSGRNISTRWQSHLRKEKNKMIGKEFDNSLHRDILKNFGL